MKNSVRLVTKLRNNMGTKPPTPIADASHLKKREAIETMFTSPKNICQVEHSIHTNIANYFNNTFGPDSPQL